MANTVRRLNQCSDKIDQYDEHIRTIIQSGGKFLANNGFKSINTPPTTRRTVLTIKLMNQMEMLEGTAVSKKNYVALLFRYYDIVSFIIVYRPPHRIIVARERITRRYHRRMADHYAVRTKRFRLRFA